MNRPTASWSGLAALLLAGTAAATPAVFSGDPVDPSSGLPYVILPGVPLVHPGADGKFGTTDDLVDPGMVGDVDLVVRTGGGYAGGAIPPPHAGVAAAPAVTVGGGATATGSDVAFQAIVSDGAPPFVTGNLLAAADLDGRPAFAVAYADLDGDGFIGPTAVDGDADDQVERQETLVPAGRQAASIAGGVATGTLALSIGAPASVGGLGVVVTAGASTGTTPFLYFDGPWIATLLPYMPPLDPDRIIGSNGVGGPEPSSLLADFELEIEKTFTPAPNHPLLGTPYAIPVDGSSPTVDLLRGESGSAVAVACGRPLDVATFVADPTRRLVPAVDPGGARAVYEPVDAIALASDGDGGAATLACFVVDRLGNATDPPPGGFAVTLEAGPRLRLPEPDTDGDPGRETITFTTAAARTLIVDDAGVPATSPVTDRVVVVRDGAPVGTLTVALAAGPGGGTGGSSALGETKTKLRFVPEPLRGRLTVAAEITAGAPMLDPAAQGLTLTLGAGGATFYTRTVAPGVMTTNELRTTFRFRDPSTVTAGRVTRLTVRRRRSSTTYAVRLRARDVDLTGVTPDVAALTLAISIGPLAFDGQLVCTPNRGATVTTCVR